STRTVSGKGGAVMIGATPAGLLRYRERCGPCASTRNLLKAAVIWLPSALSLNNGETGQVVEHLSGAAGRDRFPMGACKIWSVCSVPVLLCLLHRATDDTAEA